MNPVYNIYRDFNYNFVNGPFYKTDKTIKISNPIKLWDYTIEAPIGIGAGILLNSKWVELYSNLGYSVLTYKTVRAYKKKALSMPNCLFVNYDGGLVTSNMPSNKNNISITNHFGIPSQDPEFWMEDVEISVNKLKKNQILILSVFGETRRELLRCVEMAAETPAHAIELNVSCPNVSSDLILDRNLLIKIRNTVRVPLLIKVGYPTQEFENYIKPLLCFIDGLSMINSLKINNISLCGALLYNKLIEAIKRYRTITSLPILAMGGINSKDRVLEVLNLANVAMFVTAAIFDPLIGSRIFK